VVPAAGVYGVDVWDMWADFLLGRYLFYAESSQAARARIRDAGFHKKQVRGQWDPGSDPPEGRPAALGPGDPHWYRSRWDQAGWTPWEQLPGDFRYEP
jgi:hypothetical protein